MCLVTNQLEPKIATEDIIVYKKMNEHKDSGTIWSYHQDFQYELGKLYKTEIKESEDISVLDYEAKRDYENFYKGFNSNFGENIIDDTLKCFGEGFHSYKRKERGDIRFWSKAFLYECIIPKGSEYYEDCSNLLVSNQLIIVKKVENV